jgi:hypothetical protein
VALTEDLAPMLVGTKQPTTQKADYVPTDIIGEFLEGRFFEDTPLAVSPRGLGLKCKLHSQACKTHFINGLPSELVDYSQSPSRLTSLDLSIEIRDELRQAGRSRTWRANVVGALCSVGAFSNTFKPTPAVSLRSPSFHRPNALWTQLLP